MITSLRQQYGQVLLTALLVLLGILLPSRHAWAQG
jgi:hypothetical protein